MGTTITSRGQAALQAQVPAPRTTRPRVEILSLYEWLGSSPLHGLQEASHQRRGGPPDESASSSKPQEGLGFHFPCSYVEDTCSTIMQQVYSQGAGSDAC